MMSESNAPTTTCAGIVANDKTMKKPKIQVRVRNVQPGGKQQKLHVQIKQETQPLAAVKDAVINYLQSSWEDTDVILKRGNVKVFLVCENGAKEVGDDLEPLKSEQDAAAMEDEDSKCHKNECKFFALEYFTTVPVDLFRTVKNDQVTPATFGHPKHTTRQWTTVSPLYCAGFKDDDRKMPWCSVKESNGDFKVRGVSIRCLDENEKAHHTAEAVDPFAAIGKDEEMGVTYMRLPEEKNYESYDRNFGILESSVSHEQRTEGNFTKKPVTLKKMTEATKKTRKREKLATRRTPYFRFILKKHLDLSGYGVAVVYDNSSPYHFTLVRAHVGTNRKWVELNVPVYLPIEWWKTLGDVLGSEKEVPKDRLEGLFSHKSEPEPEYFVSDPFVYLPKVASLFDLHDMKLEASAEPVPLEGENDTDGEHHSIYEGALVLHHLDLGWNVVLSIEALEKSKYVVKNLDQSFRTILLDVLLEETPDTEAAADILGWDSNRATDALDELRDALISVAFEENVAST